MKLTRQQKIALRYLLSEGQCLDAGLWLEGVRPWPTMESLVYKGLVRSVEYQSAGLEDQIGWVRELTPLGRQIAEAL